MAYIVKWNKLAQKGVSYKHLEWIFKLLDVIIEVYEENKKAYVVYNPPIVEQLFYNTFLLGRLYIFQLTHVSINIL